MTSTTLELNKPAKIFADYLSEGQDISDLLDSLRDSFRELNSAIENFRIENLSHQEAEQFLRKLEFFISLFNSFGKLISNYDDNEFWKVWNKTADNLENLYDSLDLYLDKEALDALEKIKEGRYNELDLISY